MSAPDPVDPVDLVDPVMRHYAEHLAPIYVWMAGGLDAAFAAGAADVSEFLGSARHAVDLGAGFGMHTVPLARSGARVLALDGSPLLLHTLSQSCEGLPVRAVCADLQQFASHLDGTPDLILCMGDTLTHLAAPGEVGALLRAVAAHLAPGGTFVATFRDYRGLPGGSDRFLPVRSDDQRIATCFLEADGERVWVHDLLHERIGTAWQLRVSRYPKLRLDPGQVVRWATEAGLTCGLEAGPRGMVRLRATR